MLFQLIIRGSLFCCGIFYLWSFYMNLVQIINIQIRMKGMYIHLSTSTCEFFKVLNQRKFKKPVLTSKQKIDERHKWRGMVHEKDDGLTTVLQTNLKWNGSIRGGKHGLEPRLGPRTFRNLSKPALNCSNPTGNCPGDTFVTRDDSFQPFESRLMAAAP